jgi:hypothetical protein
MLTTRGPTTIPLADAESFRDASVRTTLARVALALVLAGFGLATFFAARDLAHRPGVPAPSRAGGVLVLDLSTSIGPDTYQQIRRTLAGLTARGERLGVVIFSDSAYEVVPPGTPPVELAPIARFFKPHAVPQAPQPFPPRLIENPRFYDNPWTASYHGGTQISTGLDLAERILDRDRIRHGRVILMSDLNESPLDQQKLNRTLLRYGQRGVRLQIVDLSPTSTADRHLYSSLTGQSVAFAPEAPAKPRASRPSPFWLVGLALVLALFLAANEHWCRRLWWQTARGEAA